MSLQKLSAHITNFKNSHILVIGDLMLDEFIWGKVNRISPEAPVPVVWVNSESRMPGGAANVATNIRALGGKVTVAGIVGQDTQGEDLVQALRKQKIDADCILHTTRPTIVKTRVIAGTQQVVRVDREDATPLKPAQVQKVIDGISAKIKNVDAVILEDYGKGLITPKLIEAVIALAKKHNKIITVDPKKEHFDLYQGITSMTPNRAEAEEALGQPLLNQAQIEKGAKTLLKRLKAESLLITLGEDGMCLVGKGKPVFIPTVVQEVYDVAGAGDTVIAAFTLALAGGASFLEAAQLSNYAAGVAVEKLGVATVSPAELKLRIEEALKSPKKAH